MQDIFNYLIFTMTHIHYIDLFIGTCISLFLDQKFNEMPSLNLKILK